VPLVQEHRLDLGVARPIPPSGRFRTASAILLHACNIRSGRPQALSQRTMILVYCAA
jgi:hypothetical protein